MPALLECGTRLCDICASAPGVASQKTGGFPAPTPSEVNLT